MIIRVLALSGGLLGAASLSQFPEYSQQYKQRLSGAVDELSGIVVQFDADAEMVGMDRTEALRDLSAGSAMARARAESMGHVLARHDRLSAHLDALHTSTGLHNTLMSWRFMDPDLAQETWNDFQPAVPARGEGIAFAGVGFLIGYTLLAGGVGAVARVMGRRKSQVPAE